MFSETSGSERNTEGVLYMESTVALTTCRECAKPVSTEAPTCPACGISNPGGVGKPVVVELTSKRYKGAQAGGVCMILVGFAAMMATATDNEGMKSVWAIVLLLGLVIAIYGRVGAWWHHR